jgi:hypothetical protein
MLKESSIDWQSAEIVSHIFREMQLHIGYCQGFGISKEQIEQTEEKEGRSSPLLKHGVSNLGQPARHTPDTFSTLDSLRT